MNIWYQVSLQFVTTELFVSCIYLSILYGEESARVLSIDARYALCYENSVQLPL